MPYFTCATASGTRVHLRAEPRDGSTLCKRGVIVAITKAVSRRQFCRRCFAHGREKLTAEAINVEKIEP